MRRTAARIALALLTLVGATLVLFLLLNVSGDPTTKLLPDSATPAERAAFRRQMGYDQPLIVQYFSFIWNALHGDFGTSLRTGQPTISVVLSRVPATLQLVIPAILLTIVVAVALAFFVAIKDGPFSRALLRFVTIAGQGVPGFVLGVILILTFSVAIPILPSSGRGDLRSFILPAIVLAAFAVPQMTWVLWSSLRQVLRSDYIRFARSLGLGSFDLYFKRALRNALGPFLTLVGLQLGVLLAGSVVTETVFAWPGLGQLMVTSIENRDYPVVQMSVAFVVLVFIVVNAVVDVLHPIVNPVLRKSR